MMPSLLKCSRIKRLILVIVLSVGLWSALFLIASAEVIRSFDSHINIASDGSMIVIETIVYDFENTQRRGIYRNVKDDHAQPASKWYNEKYLDFDLLSVTRDGQSEPYRIQDYEGLSVRIGNADVTISGEHTYVITYKVDGAMAVYDDLTELYWNATGHEWEVQIQNVTVRVTADDPNFLGDQIACYAGPTNSTDSCSSIESSQIATVFYQDSLYPGEELTVAQNINTTVAPSQLERFGAWWAIVLAGIGVFITSLVSLSIWIYRWRTEFKLDQLIIAQYEPYPDFKPMFTGVLYDGRLDPRDISAGIVYLAQQGFISIKKSTKKIIWLLSVNDYEITLKRPFEEVESNFHHELLTLLFDESSRSVGETISLSKLSRDTSKRTKNVRTISLLTKAVKQDLVDKGFYFKRPVSIAAIVLVVVLGFVTFFGFVFSPYFLVLLPVEILAIVLLVSLSTPRLSRKGYEAQNYLKGFKEFLSVTETERYTFHNAPSLSPQTFMEFLPYAIAFGVEKEWAEVFKDIQIGQPDWYSAGDGSAFNSTAFASNLGAFSSAFSSSSGSSGSSGGGSSGGGSGGGGGGSW